MDANIESQPQPYQSEIPAIQSDQKKPQQPKKSRIILILLTLFILIIAGVGSYYVIRREITQKPKAINPGEFSSPTIIPSPTLTNTVTKAPITDSTVNWKTYINSDYGYTIKYPSDWTTERADQGPGAINQKYRYYLILRRTDSTQKSEGDYLINVEVNNPSTLSGDYTKTASSIINTKISGIDSTKLEFLSTPQSPARTEYFFKRNGSEFKISILYYSKTDNMGEKIISSIEFTK